MTTRRWFGWLIGLGLVLGALHGAPAMAQSGDTCRTSPPQTPPDAPDELPLQYCFATERGIPVLWIFGGVGPDSAANVNRGLSQTARYREVWLNSPGGLVAEGFKIGNRFKQLQTTVRIPAMDNVWCVSSCTIMMLGGYNRIIEDGATFLVHASSSVMMLTSRSKISNQATWGDFVGAVASSRPELLRDRVEWYRARAFSDNSEMVKYYQSILGGTPNEAVYQEFAGLKAPLVYGQQGEGERSFPKDIELVKREGLQAVQEIITQTELLGKRLTLAAMRARESELGRGGKVALRIFEAMSSCRIQDVCQLPKHQLRSLGYHNFDTN